MKWDVRIETNSQQPYSAIDDLMSYEQGMSPYAYCLPRYAKLDGGYANAPDTIPGGKNGYVSAVLSGLDGWFITPPTITITYDRLKTSGGVSMVFSRASGDYAKRLKIAWCRDGEPVQEQEYELDGVEYFCQAKVPLFNQMVVTFLRTSRPYRYLWLSSLRNQRMTNAGGLKVVYDDIALGASEDSTASTDDKGYYVDLRDLRVGVEFPDYALCLPRYAKLDGGYANAPDVLNDMGYVSGSISDADGSFAVPPTLTFTFTRDNYSSVGITLLCNDHSGDHCSKVNIKWYRDTELLSGRDFFPNGARFFCYNIVDYYNKVVVTFLRTSRPHRNVFLAGITWGLTRVFRDDEIESCNCLTELSPISEEASINTMDYTVRSKSVYAFEFQKKQKQTLYFDEAIVGVFYLKDGKQLGEKRYFVETQDAIGILDNNQFMGGIYGNALMSDILDEIMSGEDITYFLDESYVSSRVSGYLPICSKRTALQQLAFAAGALVDTSYDRQLYVYPQRTEVSSEITKGEVFTGLSIEHSDIITGVRLYVHKYSAGTESTEIYKATLNGTLKVEFSEPYHSLVVTGGVLGNCGENYAYITGKGGEVVVTGRKYNHSTVSMLRENPKITRNKNIAEVKDATLVTASNAELVLTRVYDQCMNNESVRGRIIVGDHELGDKVSIDTGFGGVRKGTITKMDFRFTRREMTAEVVIR